MSSSFQASSIRTAPKPSPPYPKPTGDDEDPAVIRPGGLDLTRHAIGLCPFKYGAKIADVGCGAGATVKYLRNGYAFQAVGVDIAMERIKHSVKESPGLPLLQADSSALPFASETLDAIISECSLSVMSYRQKAFAEFSRVMKPGGRLIITDVFVENAHEIGPAECRQLPFCLSGLMSRENLSDIVVRNGFQVDLCEDHSHLLKSFIGRLIMESNSCDPALGHGLRILKRAKPHYLLLVATKGGAA